MPVNAYATNADDRSERNPRLLGQFLLTTTDERIYTVPADKRATVIALVVCNTGTVATTFRMHHVPPRASSSATNAQYYDARLANAATVIDQTARYLDPSDAIRGKAGAASVVSVAVYGSETPL
jgi:hypothetical protein